MVLYFFWMIPTLYVFILTLLISFNSHKKSKLGFRVPGSGISSGSSASSHFGPSTSHTDKQKNRSIFGNNFGSAFPFSVSNHHRIILVGTPVHADRRMWTPLLIPSLLWSIVCILVQLFLSQVSLTSWRLILCSAPVLPFPGSLMAHSFWVAKWLGGSERKSPRPA